MTLDKWDNPPNQINRDILALCGKIDDHILEIKEMLPFANCIHSNYGTEIHEEYVGEADCIAEYIVCKNCGTELNNDGKEVMEVLKQ